MFESCSNLSELNEARIEAIRTGTPAILVNKEYAKRKSILLEATGRSFKRVAFYPMVIPDAQPVVGIDYVFEDDPYTMYVVTEKRHG